MERDDIFTRLKKVMRKIYPTKNIDYDGINEQSTLKFDLGLDSIQIIVLALGIEMEFGVQFTNYDAQTFQTVGHVIDYIKDNAK